MSGLWSRERGACPAFLWAFLKITIFNFRSLEIFPKTPWTCSSISMNCWRNKYHQRCNLVKLAWKQVLAWENAVVRVCKPWPCCFHPCTESGLYPLPAHLRNVVKLWNQQELKRQALKEIWDKGSNCQCWLRDWGEKEGWVSELFVSPFVDQTPMSKSCMFCLCSRT